jgi:hypothetical protein
VAGQVREHANQYRFVPVPLLTGDTTETGKMIQMVPCDRRDNHHSRHDMAHAQCEQCGNLTPPWDTIHCGSGDGSYRLLCSLCFNARIAESIGFTDFENIRPEPIRMIDCGGESHQFHFQVRLLGDRVALDAFEPRGDFRRGR